MKYRCISCDHVFEAAAESKPRCPRCMTIHDVEVVSAHPAEAPKSKSRYAGAVVVVLLLAAALVAYWFTNRPTAGDEPAATATPADGLERRLAELGRQGADAILPCAADDAVRSLVAAAGAQKGQDAPEALHLFLVQAKEQGRLRAHPQREPRAEPPLTASKLAALLLGPVPQAPYEALSYELACLLVAASRAAEAKVAMVEVLEFEGTGSPADPEGQLGRYAVAVGEGESMFLLDPYDGRAKASAKGRTATLDTVQEAAPFYGLSALSSLVSRDTPAALKLNDTAVGLDGRSGWLRMGRGLVFAASGAIEEALSEMEKAVRSQEEPPLLADLAQMQLLADPSGRTAEATLLTALAKTPKFARAKALLGIVHMMRQEEDQAQAALEEAERLDPGSPSIKLLVARYYAAKADAEGAIAKAKEAVRLAGGTPSSLMGLAGIYAMTARFDEMRATLDELLAKVDSPAMAEEIKRMFNYQPTASASAGSAESSTDSDEAPSPSSGQFELKLDGGLGQGSRLGQGIGDKGGLDLKLDMGQN